MWRLAPSGFDAHGNPIFKEWQKLLTDPVFDGPRGQARPTPIHGGNELADQFISDWCQADGSAADGFYVQARGRQELQRQRRRAAQDLPLRPRRQRRLPARSGAPAAPRCKRLAKPGEMYGAMRIQPADQRAAQRRRPVALRRAALHRGRPVRGHRSSPTAGGSGPTTPGLYPQPGEFFAGIVFPNTANGQDLLRDGQVHADALRGRGLVAEGEPGAAADDRAEDRDDRRRRRSPRRRRSRSACAAARARRRLARFAPALGGAVLDGSLDRLGVVRAGTLRRPTRTRRSRCAASTIPSTSTCAGTPGCRRSSTPKPLPPLERIFTHDQLADTLSFYFQGDANAKPGGPPEGRPGDVRFVFGVFKDGEHGRARGRRHVPAVARPGEAVAAGLPHAGRQAAFAHVGAGGGGASSCHALDADGKGFVLVAAIPRARHPALPQPFAGGLRTLVNFEATFGGHNKFWWANSDGSASRETYDEPTEARLYPGSWAPAQFQGTRGRRASSATGWSAARSAAPARRSSTGTPTARCPAPTRTGRRPCANSAKPPTYPPDDGKVDPEGELQRRDDPRLLARSEVR